MLENILFESVDSDSQVKSDHICWQVNDMIAFEGSLNFRFVSRIQVNRHGLLRITTL